jgi:hypothetical protein
MIILNRSKLSIFLIYKEEGHHLRQLGGIDIILFEIFFEEFV